MDNNNWMQLFAEGAEGGTEGTPAEGGAAAPAAESGTQAHWQRVDQIYDGIVREAESLRELFPDLDLRRESRNELFCNLLRGGADVESAYCGAHFRELLPAAMAYAAEYTRVQLAAMYRSTGHHLLQRTDSDGAPPIFPQSNAGPAMYPGFHLS